jgi:hypothetical protein
MGGHPPESWAPSYADQLTGWVFFLAALGCFVIAAVSSCYQPPDV